MGEVTHYVVEIKVTRVDFELDLVATKDRPTVKKRVLDEITHIVVKNKNLTDLKALTAEHLKLVCE
jgi:hypothetical protein